MQFNHGAIKFTVSTNGTTFATGSLADITSITTDGEFGKLRQLKSKKGYWRQYFKKKK